MDNNVFYFPWVRKGLGTYIDEKDSLGQDGVALGRPGLTIKSNYTARHNQPADADADETSQIILEKTVVFSGPGDVVDVKPNAVMKVHPEEGSEGFPAKYLPYIEFWEPDFLWRYTPASENENRLRPWLALIALPEKDVRMGMTADDKPYFTFIGDDSRWNATFLKVEDLHRCAHAQGDTANDPRFCRLLGMRNGEEMDPDTAYVALLIPAYETGRLRGLGWDEEKIKDIPAQRPAWENSIGAQKSRLQGLEFPVYYKWHFKTGEDDFDTLAKKLAPVSVDKAGLKLDVTDMGEGFSYNSIKHDGYRTSITMPAATRTVPAAKESTFPGKSKEKKVYDNLFKLLSKSPVFTENKAESEGQGFLEDPGNEDPWVVPPVYGARHAMAFQLIDEAKPWLEELNLDIHNRAAAGLGRKVVQQNQEELMDRAWRQVEAVQAMNQDLYKRLCSIRANSALLAKTADQYGDSTKYIEYMMRNLTSMLGASAGEDGKDSMAEIISDAGIPASFAAASFQGNAEKLAKIVNGLDSTTLMEHIVEDQIFKFTSPDPVDSLDLDKVKAYCHNMEEGLCMGAHAKYWKKIYNYTVMEQDGRIYPTYTPREMRLASWKPEIYSDTLDIPIVPYRFVDHYVLSNWPMDGNVTFGTIKDALRSFHPEDYATYPRLYVLEDGDYDKVHRLSRCFTETADGLTFTVDGKKKLIKSTALYIPGEEYDASFIPKYYIVTDGISTYIKLSKPGVYNDIWGFGQEGTYVYPFNGCFHLNFDRVGGSVINLDNNVKVKEGIMADVKTGTQVVRKFLEASFNPEYNRDNYSLDSLIHWCQSELPEVIYKHFNSYATPGAGLSMQNGFITTLLGNLIKAYPRNSTFGWAPTMDDEFRKDSFRSFIAYFLGIKTGIMPERCPASLSYDDSMKKLTLWAKYDKLDYLSTFVYTLLDYPNLHHRIWRAATNRETTLLPSLCYLDGVGPWMTSMLLHAVADSPIYTGTTGVVECNKTLESVDQFLRSTPAFVVVPQSTWQAQKPVIMEGGIHGTLLKVAQKLYPDEFEYLNKLNEKVDSIWPAGKEVTEPQVTVNDEAVQEHKESLKHKEAFQRMKDVAEDYYQHHFADSKEGELLRGQMLEELLMSKYPIQAYPFFPEPTYHYLNLLSDKFIIPGLDQIPLDSIAMFTSNPTFTEAFLAGMNTEMGSELQWREYPTDRRGSYFRKFWDSESSVEAIQDNRFFDVEPLHLWGKTHLGENHLKDKGNLLIFAIHSDLFKLYPSTRVYLNKAIFERKEGTVRFGPERVDPVMETFIRENILLIGFNLSLSQALGNPKNDDYGYMLAFEQDLDDLNFFQKADGIRPDDTADIRADKLKDNVSIFGKHISRFVKLSE